MRADRQSRGHGLFRSAGAALLLSVWMALRPARLRADAVAEAMSKVGPLLTTARDLARKNPLVALGVGAAVGFFLIYKILKKFLSSIAASKSAKAANKGKVPTSAKGLKKAIKKAGKKGQWDTVIELAHKAGDAEALGMAYEMKEDFSRAARSYKEADNREKAIAMFEKAGDFVQAANLCMDAEDTARAAEFFVKSERFSNAAEAFEKLGNFDRAGEMLEKGGQYRRAYDMYKQSKNNMGAARVLENLLSEEKAGATGGAMSPKKKQQVGAIAKASADFYLKSGNIEKAARVLQQGGLFEPAAKLFHKAGVLDKAAELYLLGNTPLLAADVYDQMKDSLRSNQLRGEYWRAQGDDVKAANFFDQAGLYVDAASSFKAAGMTDKAAEMYAKERDWEAAADMYIQADRQEEAADCLVKGKNYTEAAKIYGDIGNLDRQAEVLLMAGEFYAAGENFFRRGNHDEAIKAFQKVEQDTLEYRRACARLGDIFLSQNNHRLAITKFRQALGSDDVGKGNIHVFYNLGIALLANDEAEETVKIFERVQAADFNYKEVGDYLAKAQQAVETARNAQARALQPGTTGGTGPLATQMLAPPQDDRYDIQEEIGRGAMGIVYKAMDKVLDRPVAYKILPDSSGDPESPQIKNFLREAKSLATLNHPNIVTVFDAGNRSGVYYLVMEFVEGKPLKSFFSGSQRLSEKAIIMITKQICKGLAYAHSKRIIHRDVKTANIMLAKDKSVKIMDFGLAKAMEGMMDTQTVVRGTPHYMAPEQILGQKLDARADLYALGVCLFEMATGRLPYEKGDVGYHHVHTPMPDPRKFNPKMSDGLANIVLKCTEKDRAKRYQSAKEIYDDLSVIQPGG